MVKTRSASGIIEHQESSSRLIDTGVPPYTTDTEAATMSGYETGTAAVTCTSPIATNLQPQGEASSACSAASSKASESKSRRRREIIMAKIELASLRVAMLEEEEEENTICNVKRTESWVTGQCNAAATPQRCVEKRPPPPLLPPEQCSVGETQPYAHQPVRNAEPTPAPTAEPTPVPTAEPTPVPIAPERGDYVPRTQDAATARTLPPPAPLRDTACQAEQNTAYEPSSENNSIDYGKLAAAMTLAGRFIQPSIAYRPPPELPIFSGASSEWLPFKAAFSETASFVSEQENLARLRRCLKGAAREAVQCLFVGTTSSAEVIRLLAARFGRPDAICMSELDKLRSLPRLNENPRDICIFSSKVTNIVATIKALGKSHYLHNAEPVRNIIEKLPPTLRNEFYNYVAEQPEDAPDLPLLAAFLERAADRCSRYAPAEVISSVDRRESVSTQPFRKAVRTYHVETPAAPAPPSSKKCPVCSKDGHGAPSCTIIKNAELSVRWELMKKHRLCFRCMKPRNFRHKCKYTRCNVSGCKNPHHPLLHDPNYVRVSTTTHVNDTALLEPEEAIVASAKEVSSSTALLKVLPVRVSGPSGARETYALLDDGSTCTLIEAAVAEAIGATGAPSPFTIEGVAGAKIEASTSKRVTFDICGRNGGEPIKISARTMNNLRLSPQTIHRDTIKGCDHLHDLSGELLIRQATPTVLVGQDNWHLLLAHTIRRGERSQPVASLTDLGWVLHGIYNSPQRTTQRLNHLREWTEKDEMEKMMREHFAMECLGIEKQRPFTDAEQRALELLGKHTRQLPAGGYETSLLWRSENPSPPDSRNTALRRLELVEKKLDRRPDIKKRYQEQIQNLLTNGYAEEAPARAHATKLWYLPHFGVTHPEKPDKLRIVHDAAAKSRSVCLNDMLLPGPDLLQSLPGVLMRFRQHLIAVTADIKDMFLRISIREEDRDMQRFLWREDHRTGPPIEYRMKSVIFGATSSPCTAIYVKNHNAQQFTTQYPEAAKAIVSNHYMDDYLTSFANEVDAERVSREVDFIHRHANFHLAKWMTNSPRVLTKLAPNTTTAAVLELDPTKVLGMIWDPQRDTLSFNVNEHRIDGAILRGERTPTKREALRAVMSIYDPLGLATPVTVQAKRILQDTWRSGIEWDAPLQPQQASAWKHWGQHVLRLPLLTVPRCYTHYTTARIRELHVFVDASSTAYATAVYWRVIDEFGAIHISLITAKGRVAPINKVISIPRLELQAAVMGCRLAETAQQEHDIKPTLRIFWTDSRTVLAWIRNGPQIYKPFVAHRIAEIHEHTKTNEWRWVPTKDNVADDATRDTPNDFTSEHRWLQGPAFLHDVPTAWPLEDTITTLDPETKAEERICMITTTPSILEALPDVKRFSSWLRVIRVTGRILQFIKILRARLKINHEPACTIAYKRTKKRNSFDPTWRRTTQKPSRVPKVVTNIQPERKLIPLDVLHLDQAKQLWIKAQQQEAFSKEIALIKQDHPLPTDSRLSKLAVKIDDEGILRLRSRIAAAINISEEQREPAILDGNHQWTRLYIAWVHRHLHHAGLSTTANEVRQYYWVLRLRYATRQEVKGCLTCRIRRTKPAQPSTGNHPPSRLAHGKRPFTFTGIDFFGPMTITVGRTHQKRYGVLFTCLTTRAVHLEIAGSLSSDSAIMALRRFIGRRGCPTELHSDNGTNLRGADIELQSAARQALAHEASVRFIRWQYIPPSAPFMGGAWERLVRSVKAALVVTLNERAPKEEVLSTLLVEIEHTINSRPLTHVSMDSDDPEALTPNHFLLGGPSRVPLPGAFIEADAAGRKDWRISQRLADIFWARWVREYLPELQHRREPRAKGGSIKVGDLVLIADGTLPRNSWPRGVVVNTYPGADGETRVVDVQTNKRILRRPTKKLAVLPS